MRVLPIVAFLCGSVAMAQPISFGIRGGVPFTGSFEHSIGVDTSTMSGPTSYLIGPMLEVHLPFGFSVEGDALYHPLNLKQNIVTSTLVSNGLTFQSWEFPVLVKYRFLHTPVIKPLIEAGPAFRATGQALNTEFSKAGFELGGGVEIKLGHFRIEPELRYIRWGSDSTVNGVNFAPSNLNQGELTLGLAF